MERHPKRLLLAIIGVATVVPLVACGSGEALPERDRPPVTAEQDGGNPAPESPGAQQEGEQLARSKCTQCHTFDRVQQADKDRPGWERTIERMIGNGLRVTDEERQKIVDYLVARDEQR